MAKASLARRGNSLIGGTPDETLGACVDVIELLQAVEPELMRDRSEFGRFLLLDMVSDALRATRVAMERPQRTPRLKRTAPRLTVVPSGDSA